MRKRNNRETTDLLHLRLLDWGGIRLVTHGGLAGATVRSMHQYEQLTVWQRSMALAASLQGEARSARQFIDRTAWSQIMRVASSVPANIAEGAMRSSPRDFANFLSIAIGSAAELHALLLIAADSGLVDFDRATDAANEARELRQMLVSLRGRILGQQRQRAPR
ncbi:MAG: four helix bundle protein [Gemmatimonas sp.]|nr:four helix bundle protein [Gemmatimonas sp.]